MQYNAMQLLRVIQRQIDVGPTGLRTTAVGNQLILYKYRVLYVASVSKLIYILTYFHNCATTDKEHIKLFRVFIEHPSYLLY